ncbi:uncharacterized protein LOC115409719 [Salarias fasciatus]|uniref:uncharacterized protein LOC115409719 n=1 Tax=Salarias fasciatus TaxID=181472 RepID=UPI0011766970|nr:uncharacterized protein LOC115409719 [Salarias fasciatus]
MTAEVQQVMAQTGLRLQNDSGRLPGTLQDYVIPKNRSQFDQDPNNWSQLYPDPVCRSPLYPDPDRQSRLYQDQNHDQDESPDALILFLQLTMSGGGGRRVFLSAHRCPEVDVLPRRLSEDKAPPSCSPPPADRGSGEAGYLDVCSTCRSDHDEDNEDNLSDWSEEDLSLHFSPSVILQSEDEDSDPESGFECIDVTMATQVTGPEGAVPKMVPKRQIQLRKKNAEQVKREPAEVGGVNDDTSAVCPRADLLLRQHSMPASLHQTSNGDVIGLMGGASQGSLSGGRRLQKSLSLDETKAKQASSLIRSVLSKRMQVERTTTAHLKNSPVLPPSVPQSGPVHVVRDVRSLLKNTPGLPVSTSSQAIGPKDSPPPSYQQAVQVKGHPKVAQPNSKKSHTTSGRPVLERRRSGEPIRRGSSDDVNNAASGSTSRDLTGRGQSKCSVGPGPPGVPNPPGAPSPPGPPGPAQPGPPACARDQSSLLEASSQQTLQPCFYAAAPPPRLVRGPLSCVATQLPAPVRLTGTVPGPPDRTGTAGDQGGHGPAGTPATRHRAHQHPLLCSFQGFLPAPVGGDYGVDVTGSAATPAAAFGSAPRLMVDQNSRQCFYLEAPAQPQVKTLLDPETGQFVQVVLPAAGSASSGTLYPVGYAHPAPTVLSPAHTVMNPAPLMLQVGGANHPMFSVMHLHPRVGVSSLYPLQPLTVMTSRPTHSDDITPDAQ